MTIIVRSHDILCGGDMDYWHETSQKPSHDRFISPNHTQLAYENFTIIPRRWVDSGPYHWNSKRQSSVKSSLQRLSRSSGPLFQPRAVSAGETAPSSPSGRPCSAHAGLVHCVGTGTERWAHMQWHDVYEGEVRFNKDTFGIKKWGFSNPVVGELCSNVQISVPTHNIAYRIRTLNCVLIVTNKCPSYVIGKLPWLIQCTYIMYIIRTLNWIVSL